MQSQSPKLLPVYKTHLQERVSSLCEQTSNGPSDERRIKAKARPQDSALILGSKRKHHSACLDPSHGWDTMNNSVTQEFKSRDFLEQSKGSVCGSCRQGVTNSTWMGPKGRSLPFAHLQPEKCDVPPSLTSSPITASQLTFTLTSTELAVLQRYLNLSHLTTLAHPCHPCLEGIFLTTPFLGQEVLSQQFLGSFQTRQHPVWTSRHLFSRVLWLLSCGSQHVPHHVILVYVSSTHQTKLYLHGTEIGYFTSVTPASNTATDTHSRHFIIVGCVNGSTSNECYLRSET